MHRRKFLQWMTALAAAPAFGASLPATPPASRTRWAVRTSEGLDAIAFLGPLSGGELYQRYYADDVAAIARALPAGIPGLAQALYADASAAGFGLLAPTLSILFSVDGAHESIDALIASLADREDVLLGPYRASPYWDEKKWAWFDGNAARLGQVFEALRDGGFRAFRKARIGDIDRRITDLQAALAAFDVVKWQEKLTGRGFDPEIRIVLLQFSKPHGVKVQGQTFLQAADYAVPTTVRIAAHEMLHPPIDMEGRAAVAALDVFSRDARIARIVRDHDPKWGYTTLDGLFNEDLCQALDQLISEALGVARNPADRWNKADSGIHVMAAGFYGMLRGDRWQETGGSLEGWVLRAAQAGRFDPKPFHATAARILERRAGEPLWRKPAAEGA